VRQRGVSLWIAKHKMVIMASIVTYDVWEKHIELRKALLDLGYSSTLYHATKSPEEAIIDVENICKALQIGLAQCVATKLNFKNCYEYVTSKL
jgi:hypothetical protein